MTTTIQHTCRKPDVEGGPRLLNLEHLRDCNLSGCPGCSPCVPRWGHCAVCLHAHLDADHPRTCPSCVGKVRNDILELVDKTATAHTEHVHRSIGSVLFMVAGPAANYEAHRYVTASVHAGRLCKCLRRGFDMCLGDLPRLEGPRCKGCRHDTCRILRKPPMCPDAAFILEETRDDDRHPATVLFDWALTVADVLDQDPPVALTDEYGHEPPVELTMGQAQRYLLGHLTALAQMPADEFDFADLGKSLASAHDWLVDVLRLGHRPDQAGWCPMCKKAKLEKDWDDEDEGTGYDPARDGKEYADQWVCPNPECKQVYKPGEYRERLDLMYVESADRLPAEYLAQRIRVAWSTIRRWASEQRKLISPVHVDPDTGQLVDAVWDITPPRLRSCGRDAAGRKVYRVADALAIRDALRKDAS